MGLEPARDRTWDRDSSSSSLGHLAKPLGTKRCRVGCERRGPGSIEHDDAIAPVTDNPEGIAPRTALHRTDNHESGAGGDGRVDSVASRLEDVRPYR
jgi:hypothetical protein